ncbi:MAG: 2-hydroxychromene-2-carboxylate isomerase [Pseudomonadota bacterium]
MKKQLEFFFDFMSPFAYLAETQLSALVDRFGLEIRYVPLDLPVAKLAAGNTGPSNRQVPAKLRYLTTDMQRWAKRYNLLPLVFPENFASERANRGLFFAIDKGQQRDYVHQMFQAVWGRGEDMTDESVLRRVAEGLGWSGDEFLAYTIGEDSAQRFAEANKETHERGVFGVPTMFIDGEMWWGNDRLQFVEEYLASHSR